MHQYVMSLDKMMAVCPGKHLLHRQNMAILNHLFTALAFFFIDIIADEHVQCLTASCQLPQSVQNLKICILLHPVIAVHYFKIQSLGIGDSGIHCRAMSAVLLMDSTDNGRELCLIFICDLCGTILGGSVINDQDLYILTADEQRINTFSHILFRIVAGNCYGK